MGGLYEELLAHLHDAWLMGGGMLSTSTKRHRHKDDRNTKPAVHAGGFFFEHRCRASSFQAHHIFGMLHLRDRSP